MMKWAFGGNSEEREQNEELARSSSQGMQTLSHNAVHAGENIDSDDVALLDMPAVPGGEAGGSLLGESLDTPERHAQLSSLIKIRKDIEDFDYHITQNEIHLKHSREQLDGFKTFVQHTDVEMEEIHRLRRQNGEFETNLATDDLKIKELMRLLEVEKAGHSATKNRNIEFKDVLISARGEIVSLVERDSKFREQLEQYSNSSGKREAKLLDVTRKYERLSAENKVLDENYQRTNLDMNKFRKESTELQKKLDEIIENGRQDTAEVDRLTANLTSATDTLDKYQAENVELQSKLDNLVTESAASDKRYSAKVRIREEELFSLRSQVDGLQSELRVRNQMLAQAVEEGKNARNELNVSVSTAQSVSDHLAREVGQNEEQRTQILEANAEIAEINKRFKEMLGELEQSRKENLHLKRLLKAERQMFEQSINGLPLKNESRESEGQSELSDLKVSKLN